jgi:hypothetical protein
MNATKPPTGLRYAGADLTPDEVAFGRAVEAYQRAHGRLLNASDPAVLEIAHALGYRKNGPRECPAAP